MTSHTHSMNHAAHEALERQATQRATLGFWLYIMSDCLIFATLFATYAVLHSETFGAPSAREIFEMPFVLMETLVLLLSSFTCGLGILSMHGGKARQTAAWFTVTLILGLTFLALELTEFHKLYNEGADWSRSAFLSSYFSLVGTHGLHVALGSVWMFVLILMTLIRGLNEGMTRRLLSLSLFWHFLDIVWIFIFTFVYLLGSAS